MSNVTSVDDQRNDQNSQNLRFEAEDGSNPMSRRRKFNINPWINLEKVYFCTITVRKSFVNALRIWKLKVIYIFCVHFTMKTSNSWRLYHEFSLNFYINFSSVCAI